MHQSTLPCDFALPAEWEPQSAIMLTWPHAGTDWKPYLPEITDTYLELADIITRYEQLLVATPDVPATRYQLKKKLSAEQMSRVLLYEVESNDTWVRDHGPLTMVLRKKQNTWMVPYRILDFKFNGWGEKFRWEKDNAITLQLYYQAAFNADIENHQGFVLEGGSIESDGRVHSSPPHSACWRLTATSHSTTTASTICCRLSSSSRESSGWITAI